MKAPLQAKQAGHYRIRILALLDGLDALISESGRDPFAEQLSKKPENIFTSCFMCYFRDFWRKKTLLGGSQSPFLVTKDIT
uniref:Transcriptional regulator n=1 Tax=Steinernema glaseri TaxID=37863 RepID=A0A1I7Y5U8_9BILA